MPFAPTTEKAPTRAAVHTMLTNLVGAFNVIVQIHRLIVCSTIYFTNILPDCEDETEILVSRPRREVSPRDSMAELEDLHATIRSLQQRISDLEKKCTS